MHKSVLDSSDKINSLFQYRHYTAYPNQLIIHATVHPEDVIGLVGVLEGLAHAACQQ